MSQDALQGEERSRSGSLPASSGSHSASSLAPAVARPPPHQQLLQPYSGEEGGGRHILAASPSTFSGLVAPSGNNSPSSQALVLSHTNSLSNIQRSGQPPLPPPLDKTALGTVFSPAGQDKRNGNKARGNEEDIPTDPPTTEAPKKNATAIAASTSFRKVATNVNNSNNNPNFASSGSNNNNKNLNGNAAGVGGSSSKNTAAGRHHRLSLVASSFPASVGAPIHHQQAQQQHHHYQQASTMEHSGDGIHANSSNLVGGNQPQPMGIIQMAGTGIIGEVEITEVELNNIRRIFEEFDADGNKTIDVGELQSCLKSIGHYLSTEQVEELIEEVTENPDKRDLGFEEFVQLILFWRDTARFRLYEMAGSIHEQHIQASLRAPTFLTDVKWRWFWDLLVFVLSVYSFCATPLYYVQPIREDSSTRIARIILEIITTLVFFGDVFCCLKTSFIEGVGGRILVTDTKRIFSRYAASWLVPDVLTAIPWLLIPYAGGQYLAWLRSIKIFKFILGGFWQHSGRVQIDAEYVHFHYKHLPIIEGFGYFICVVHSIGAFALVIDPSLRYSTAMYYSMYIMSAVGSGEVQQAVDSDEKKWYTGFAMLLAMFVNGYVVGNIVNYFQLSDVEGEKKVKLRETSAVCEFFGIPESLKNEILQFQDYVQQHKLQLVYYDLVKGLPDEMKTQLSIYIRMRLLGEHPLFSRAHQGVRVSIAQHLDEIVFCPEEFISIAGEDAIESFFIGYGFADVVSASGYYFATLKQYDFFGEGALFAAGQKRSLSVKALTYCDTFTLSRETFQHILQRYPLFRKLVKEVETERKIEAEKAGSFENFDEFAASMGLLKPREGGKAPDDSDVRDKLKKSVMRDYMTSDLASMVEAIYTPSSFAPLGAPTQTVEDFFKTYDRLSLTAEPGGVMGGGGVGESSQNTDETVGKERKSSAKPRIGAGGSRVSTSNNGLLAAPATNKRKLSLAQQEEEHHHLNGNKILPFDIAMQAPTPTSASSRSLSPGGAGAGGGGPIEGPPLLVLGGGGEDFDPNNDYGVEVQSDSKSSIQVTTMKRESRVLTRRAILAAKKEMALTNDLLSPSFDPAASRSRSNSLYSHCSELGNDSSVKTPRGKTPVGPLPLESKPSFLRANQIHNPRSRPETMHIEIVQGRTSQHRDSSATNDPHFHGNPEFGIARIGSVASMRETSFSSTGAGGDMSRQTGGGPSHISPTKRATTTSTVHLDESLRGSPRLPPTQSNMGSGSFFGGHIEGSSSNASPASLGGSMHYHRRGAPVLPHGGTKASPRTYLQNLFFQDQARLENFSRDNHSPTESEAGGFDYGSSRGGGYGSFGLYGGGAAGSGSYGPSSMGSFRAKASDRKSNTWNGAASSSGPHDGLESQFSPSLNRSQHQHLPKYVLEYVSRIEAEMEEMSAMLSQSGIPAADLADEHHEEQGNEFSLRSDPSAESGGHQQLNSTSDGANVNSQLGVAPPVISFSSEGTVGPGNQDKGEVGRTNSNVSILHPVVSVAHDGSTNSRDDQVVVTEEQDESKPLLLSGSGRPPNLNRVDTAPQLPSAAASEPGDPEQQEIEEETY